MDIENGRKIYPDHEADGIAWEPSDWVHDGGPFARHLPTSSIWAIDFDRDSPSGGRKLADWYSRLVHVCDGIYRPDEGFDEETMDFLGRGALAFYLQAIGAWKPDVKELPDTALQKEIKARYRGRAEAGSEIKRIS